MQKYNLIFPFNMKFIVMAITLNIYKSIYRIDVSGKLRVCMKGRVFLIHPVLFFFCTILYFIRDYCNGVPVRDDLVPAIPGLSH